MDYKAKQEELNKEKWLLSEKYGMDATGKMKHCTHCSFRNYPFMECVTTEENRNSKCLCAYAFEAMELREQLRKEDELKRTKEERKEWKK